LLLPRRSNARGGKDGQEMEPAGSQAPSKGGTKVKQSSPSSQLWVALSLLASPWTLPSPSRLNSCLTLDGDSVSVYFVSDCRLVKHLSRVLVPSAHVEEGGFDQSLQLPAMATGCASFLWNGASLRSSKMFCSTRSHRRHASFFHRFHPAETTPPKRARSFSTSSHTEGNVLSPRGSATAWYFPSQSLPGLSLPLN
jgi:hypothetical protein